MPSSRHPAARASRRPCPVRTAPRCQTARTHRQPIPPQPEYRCSPAEAARQPLPLRIAGSSPGSREHRQAGRTPGAASGSVRPLHNCGWSAGTGRTFPPARSETAFFQFAAVLPFLQTSYGNPHPESYLPILPIFTGRGILLAYSAIRHISCLYYRQLCVFCQRSRAHWRNRLRALQRGRTPADSFCFGGNCPLLYGQNMI